MNDNDGQVLQAHQSQSRSRLNNIYPIFIPSRFLAIPHYWLQTDHARATTSLPNTFWFPFMVNTAPMKVFRIGFRLTTLFSISFITLISCRKQINTSQGSLTLSKNVITLDTAIGSHDTLVVYSTVQWQASIEPGVDWLQIDKTSGSAGNTVIRISVLAGSQSITSKSATVKFAAVGNNSIQPIILTVTLRPFGFSLVFHRTFGGTKDDESAISAIAATSDGGMVIAGTSNSEDGDISHNDGGYDILLLKLTNSGDTIWSKTYGGTGTDVAASIIATSDGGFAVAGYSRSHDGDVPQNHGGSDVWVLKLDASGKIQWSRTFGGTADEAGRSITQTPDGGYAVVGFAQSNDGDIHSNHGSADVSVFRLNAQGDVVWTRTYGGSNWDEARQIILTPDGGFVFTGLTYSNDGDVVGFHPPVISGADIWVVKLNSSGDKIWTKTLGGSADDVGQSIVRSIGGGYLVTAYAESNDGDITDHHGNTLFNDTWVVKLDDNGNKIWSKTYGGSLDDEPTSLITASDGGYVLAGGTDSSDGDFAGSQGTDDNMWILKLDANGNKQWSKKLGGSNDDICYSIALDSAGAYWLAGTTNSNDGDIANSGFHGDYDLLVARLVVQ